MAVFTLLTYKLKLFLTGNGATIMRESLFSKWRVSSEWYRRMLSQYEILNRSVQPN